MFHKTVTTNSNLFSGEYILFRNFEHCETGSVQFRRFSESVPTSFVIQTRPIQHPPLVATDQTDSDTEFLELGRSGIERTRTECRPIAE